MNDTDFIPLIASHLGVSASTLVFLIFCLNQAAKVGSRIIPNDATGSWAILRNLCAVLGADPSSRLTNGVSVQDVTTQLLTPPADKPVAQKVADAKGVPVSEITPDPTGA
jgi:hypothetical protein